MSVRKRWREILVAPGVTPLPGAHDGLSARLIEAAGFEALCAGGYAALGSMLGAPDMGQSNVRDMADHYARIVDAVSIPVFVDADTGFGGVNNVHRMVRAFEKAGVAGLFFGDQVFPNRCGYLPGKEVIGVEPMLAKLNAALDARTDPDLFIAARTDVFQLEGPDVAIERSQLFMEAGADMAMAQGMDTPELIARSCREVPGRQLANHSHAGGSPKTTIEQLEELGVNAVTYPSALLFAAAGGMARALEALKAEGSFGRVENELMALDDYYALTGLQAMLDRERDWDERAAALAETKA
jgi:methylisocitrate lyase